MRFMDAALHEGYETSRRMQLRHDPTYYFATRRLPAEIRPATHALYGYVRTADQIVDGPRRPPTPADRRAALDAWEAELEAGSDSCQPIVRALADAAARHRLPLGELRTYMCSMRIDCAPVRIGSWTSSWPTWTARRARSGGSWPRCWAFRRAIIPTSASSGSRSSSRTSSATCPRTRAWTGSTSPRRTARASASANATSPRRTPRPRSARCSRTRSSAPAPVRRRPPGDRLRARLRAPRHPLRDRALRPHARPRGGGRLRRARPPRRRPHLAPARRRREALR